VTGGECSSEKYTGSHLALIGKNRCAASQGMIKKKGTQKLIDSPAKDFGCDFCVLFIVEDIGS